MKPGRSSPESDLIGSILYQSTLGIISSRDSRLVVAIPLKAFYCSG
jgi:hypothetical protein